MSLVGLPPFYNMRWTNEDGSLTVDASLFSDETNQTLITAITLLNLITDARVINDGTSPRGTVINDALKAPQKTGAQITTLGADTSIPAGAIFFNTDTSKLNLKVGAGSIEAITSA